MKLLEDNHHHGAAKTRLYTTAKLLLLRSPLRPPTVSLFLFTTPTKLLLHYFLTPPLRALHPFIHSTTLFHTSSGPHNPPTATDCGRCRCRYTSEPSQPAPLFFAPSSTTHSQRHGSSSTSSRERKKWNPRLSTLAKYGIIGNILQTLRDFPTLGTGGIAFTGEIFVF